MTESIFI